MKQHQREIITFADVLFIAPRHGCALHVTQDASASRHLLEGQLLGMLRLRLHEAVFAANATVCGVATTINNASHTQVELPCAARRWLP
jgi:hypothetical protein